MISADSKGYTILEAIIVLAVSAGMFVFLSTTFGGRQQQVQFTQAVRDFDSQLKDLQNDIGIGYYPANDSIECTSTNGSNPKPRIEAGTAADLGSNDECVSIGKIIHFSLQDNDPGTVNDQYIHVYNVVGLRQDENGANPTTVTTAVPTAAPDPSRTELKWGLRVKRVMYVNDPASESSAIALFSSFNRGLQLLNSETSEAVQVALVPDVAKDTLEADLISRLDFLNTSGHNWDVSAPQVIICVTDADDKRKATITLGGKLTGSVIDFDNYSDVECGP